VLYADNALIEPHVGPWARVPMPADRGAGCFVVVTGATSGIGRVLVEEDRGRRSDTAAGGAIRAAHA